ncbi:NAD(P)-binding domain-containing protein [Spirosoma sp. SC4-14]|uniref:NADPH-dependent F420 reductase n=1 Tax=Spirosoma sp. SC4-14 TaxID=3128900 RepID=UPI0030CAA1BA
MNIAILGAGNIGGTLAEGFAKKGHRIVLGVRNPDDFKADALLATYPSITAHSVSEAALVADLIIVSTPSKAVVEVANQIGSAKGKYIVDATNGPIGTPDYPNAVAALKAITDCSDVVKCFNTTGFENLKNPSYNGEGIDLFMAGSSQEAKETVRLLALELGFSECYDLGDDAKIGLVEQLAFAWVTLAFASGLGRNFALKVVKR